jgi:Flp pilus assembly protein TadD
LNGALRLFGELAESTDVEQAPAALVALGRLAETRGDTRGATTAYERAIEFDHASHSLAARSNLAILWARAGDHERAEKALLEVADASHPQESPRALLNLGVINDADGDTDAAASVWQAAADQSTNPGVASDAALRLGLLHVARKNLALAQPYLHRVANGGPSPNRALAAVNLGVILSSQGDTAGAQKQYRLAQSEGSAQIAEVASQLLQSLDAAD